MVRAEQGWREGDAGTILRPSPEPIIQLRDLVKVYETGAGGFTAINGINLDIRRGEFLGVIGKSGAGKTTLLNLISGVSELTSGEVLFYAGVDPGARGNANEPRQRKAISVQAMDEDELAVWRGRQHGDCLPVLRADASTEPDARTSCCPRTLLGTYRPRISQAHALELLDRVELTEHAYKLPAPYLRRPEAAHRHCPGPGQRPAGDHCRRADRQPGHGDHRDDFPDL